MIEELIPPMLAGERLDRIVAMLSDVSRTVATELIEGGHVLVGGKVATSGKVRMKESVAVSIDTSFVPVPHLPQADDTIPITLVYEDDDIIVIDKPAGLVVHPATGNETGTLVNGLLALFPEIADVGQPERPGIVHRLDVGTSGLMIVARTQDAYDELVEKLRDHEVERVYRALVWGSPEAPNGLIDAPLGRDAREPLKMAVNANGREARTHFQVDERFTHPPTALLTCRLETGRTHQIRVHLTAIGHPVVADTTYGGRRATLGLKRPFLHATHLSFEHPITSEPVHFDSPMPADLLEVVTKLRADTGEI